MKKSKAKCCFLLFCFLLFACEERPGKEAQPGEAGSAGAGLIAAARDCLQAAEPVAAKLLYESRVEAARYFLTQAREVEAKMTALHPEAGEEADAASSAGIVQGKVEKGDTIAEILGNAGNGEIREYVNAAARIFPLKSFKAGQPYMVITDPQSGKIRRFEYELNDRHRLIVEGENTPRARLEEIEYTTLLEACEGRIDDSLFQAVADMGESPQLALRLVDLFGSEINFIRDIRPGDSFSVLIEKRFREGEYRGYGRILAATFTVRGKTWEAYLFRDVSGNLHNYNAAGENLKKTLLMAPLAVTRLTSRFTHARKHPILGGTRPHLGVDYGAPTGTPVKAVGHGTVIRRGWSGGYGNQIVLRHDAGLESMYSHLSGFGQGLKVGQRVKQGQVIGFVGSTGLSTGPHLDFRLRQNGEFINPAKAINPRGAPVEPGLMAAFKKTRDLCRAYLNGKPVPAQYLLDSVVPARVSLPKTEKGLARGKAVRLRRGGKGVSARVSRVKAKKTTLIRKKPKNKRKKRS